MKVLRKIDSHGVSPTIILNYKWIKIYHKKETKKKKKAAFYLIIDYSIFGGDAAKALVL